MKEITMSEVQNDPNLRNEFIESKIPFVVYIASQTLGRYLETENDIEYLIGLEALNEAIDKFDQAKGNFETFAGTLIRNRIIDEMRKHDASKMAKPLEAGDAITDDDAFDLKVELNEFKTILKQYGLDFDKVVTLSPTHLDTRLRALRCAKKVSLISSIVIKIKKTLSLPIRDLLKEKLETRRFLYAHKHYILFSSLAFIHELSIITDWIKEVLGGEHDEDV